jgi:hydroxylaminobenzene mutase
MIRNLPDHDTRSHRLLQAGFLLFLLGLLTGFAVPLLMNPRMGLSSHLEGVMNGIVLMVLGLLWPRLGLRPRLLAATYWLALYGTFANWLTTLLSAVLGAGARSMPFAGSGMEGAPWQESIVYALLASLSIAMVAVCVLVLWGLHRGWQARADKGGATTQR